METLPKKEYKKIVDKMPILCVDIVIVKNGKYLLVKRKNNPLKGKYWTPGGRVYKGETLENSAIRKAKEETGLDIKIITALGYYEDFYKKNELGLDYVHTSSIVFLAQALNDEVILDNQSEDYVWRDKLPDIGIKKW